jgi:hypothetical protein
MIDAVFILVGWYCVAVYLFKSPKYYDPVDPTDEDYEKYM